MISKAGLLSTRILERLSSPFGGKKHAQRLVMTLIARDEADIIADNIEYHLNAGVDFIVAMDNHSVDSTTGILRDFEKLGCLEYIYEPSVEYLQSAWMTKLAQIAFQKHGADWVINNDADEFFIPQNGSLKNTLKSIPDKIGAILVSRNEMVPIERPENSSPVAEMVYRKAKSLEWYTGKPIVDKVIHRGFPDVQISRGAHSASSQFIHTAIPCPGIFTLHYPIRSLTQFTNKVQNIGAVHVKNKAPKTRYNHWYTCLMDGKLDELYRQYQLDTQHIQQKLATGEIIEDRTLANIMAQIKPIC